MVGADYTRGRLVAGLSLARSHGVGGYAGRHAGHVESSATGLYPWLGYRVSDRVSVWGVTGYGGGVLRLTPDGAAPIESGLSMAMAAAGTRGELMGSGAGGGFKLAFKSDALWVGTSIDGADGAAGKLARAAADGDADAHGHRGLAALHPRRPDGADAERGGGAPPGRRRRRNRNGHGRGRRSRVHRPVDGAVSSRTSPDAGGAPSRRIHRPRDVPVARLEPHAGEPAGGSRHG